MLRLTRLAPDIVQAILDGRQPRHLNLHAIRGRQADVPVTGGAATVVRLQGRDRAEGGLMLRTWLVVLQAQQQFFGIVPR